MIKRHKIWVFTICLSSVIFYLACNVSRLRDDTYSEVYDMQNLPNTQSNPGVNNIPYKGITFADTTVPADIANPADPIQAAEFAWKEFIALAWPAKENSTPGMSGYYRTHPSNTGMLGSTGSGGVTVFDTYFHRAELFPTYATGNGKVLPPPDALPNYDYGSANIVPAPGADLTLFNNLDEASEINIAFMYYTPFAIKADAAKNTANNASGFFSNKAKAQKNIEPAVLQNAASDFAAQEAIKASLMYEAKGNLVYFNYLKENGLNNIIPRRTAKNKAIGLIKNMTTDTTGAFNLPFGTIEIKATYRRYDSKMDDLKKFHWTKAIYYTEKKSGGVTTLIANNDTMLLLSLHIIQKTPNVPTFTFATFEHVDNEKGGFRFTNVNPQTYTPPYQGNIRALPDPGIITAKRQFPVPANIEQYNNNIQTLLRNQFGNDIV